MDLYIKEVQKLHNSGNISILILIDLQRETHRYFIEHIPNVPHIKTVSWNRFVQFVTSLLNCHKLCIRLLVDLSKHDLRTVLCKNIESIAQDCNVEFRNLNKFCVKQNMIYNHIPLDQEWKLPILHKLLKVKEDNFVLNNFDDIMRSQPWSTFYVLTRNYIYILYFILVFVLSILPLCTKKSIVIIMIKFALILNCNLFRLKGN